MNCRNALLEAKGDMEKALQVLRQQGLLQAQKKAGRSATEGIIKAYIHIGGHIGAMVELNCETDFVARTDDFQTLGKDLCLQIAAANPLWLDEDDIPEEELEKEKEIYRKQAAGRGKPEKIIDKIV